MNSDKLAALEALLFLHGEPLTAEKIASFLKISAEEAAQAAAALAQNYAAADRGISLIEKGGSYQLATKPAFGDFLEQFAKESLKEELTPAALETLSLIAYCGPLTRAHIDFVRGVNSSFTLRNLLMRGLVERKQAKGNMYAYEVTFDFLKQLGLSRPEELPKFEEYRKLRDQLVAQMES